jgi:integrase
LEGFAITNPRVYRKGEPKTFKNVDQEASKALRERPILSEQEVIEMLSKADEIKNMYFRLRVKALIGLLKVFGKRRIELILLEMSDLKDENGFLFVNFTIAKKHKLGLFQYIKYLEAQIKKGLMVKAELDSKTHIQLQTEWRKWVLTEEGYRIKKIRKPKATPLTDKYAQLIFEYYEYMKTHYPKSKFLFPSGTEVFGTSYTINVEKALSGRQLLRLTKPLNPQVWLHLFRKTKGERTAQLYGRTLSSVAMVKDTLDLSSDVVAMKYVDNAVPKIETGEIEPQNNQGKKTA